MNGDMIGPKKPNARDLTAEIERETSLAIEAQDVAERGVMAHEQAVNLGNKILTYNPEHVTKAEQQRGNEAERVENVVAKENGLNMEGPILAGEESEIQIREREAWNQENLLNELDPKRDNEAKMVAHDQMGIGREMANWTEKVTRMDNLEILKLESARFTAINKMLSNLENPRSVGSSN